MAAGSGKNIATIAEDVTINVMENLTTAGNMPTNAMENLTIAKSSRKEPAITFKSNKKEPATAIRKEGAIVEGRGSIKDPIIETTKEDLQKNGIGDSVLVYRAVKAIKKTTKTEADK